MTQKRQSSDKFACLAFLALFAGVATSIALAQPSAPTPPLFPNPPDETLRILVPRFICEHGALPTGFEEEVQRGGHTYAFQPGLPYIAMGWLMRLMSTLGVSGWGLVVTARLINVGIGTVNAYMLYLLGRRLFRFRWATWLFAVGCAFHPQHLFLHTYVNTESLCMLSITMMGYALVRLYQDGPTYGRCLLLASGQVFCALTYYNAYGFLLCSLIVFVLYFVKYERGKRLYIEWEQARKYVIFTFLLVFCGAGWWFIRNIFILDGDIFGLKSVFHLQKEYAIAKQSPQDNGMGLLEMLSKSKTKMFNTFVATFGAMRIHADRFFYDLYRYFFLIGIILYSGTNLKKIYTTSKHIIFFNIAVCFAICLTLLLWCYYSYTVDYQPQGRYIMPIVIPLYYYTVSGYTCIDNIIFKKNKCYNLTYRIFYYIPTLCVLCLSVYYIYIVAYPCFFSTPHDVSEKITVSTKFIKRDCYGHIDDLKIYGNYYVLQGWIVHSPNKTADKILAYMVAGDNSIGYYDLTIVNRYDIIHAFKSRSLKKSGFVSAVPINIDYTLGYLFDKQFYQCKNLTIKSTNVLDR